MDSLPHRLSALSTVANDSDIPIPPQNALLINHCLATIESLLQGSDPATSPDPNPSTEPRTETDREADISQPPSISISIFHSQLNSLLGEISSLAHQLDQRRDESARVYAGFSSRCRFLEEAVLERKVEVRELRDDILDDALEMEGVQGTVGGLERWITSWEGRQDENLLEGITAWIRGWKDVQDVFCARQLRRRRRREERARRRIHLHQEPPPLL